MFRRTLLDGSTVAVVDDDASVREALRALLRSAGFRVKLFDSAEEFLRSGQASDVASLVLDVRMSGMSGLDLQEHLAASGAAIPIVFMTAHADATARARALAAGAVAFLEKPFSDDDLLDAIDRALGRP
ncbi:MAG TPA: response regulator [Myxococcaceae bacterium]|nr:response regulator [Myxococcaceae bacterium]